MICSTLSGQMTIKHPKLGILVREDGCVLGKAYKGRANWTKGWKDKSTGYMRIQINRKRFYVHRLVMEAFVGECPEGMSVDHINRDRTDNRRCNLRFASAKEQCMNSSKADKCAQKYGIRWAEDSKEYERRKYLNNRDRILSRTREHYSKHREEINAKRRLAYAARRRGTSSSAD